MACQVWSLRLTEPVPCHHKTTRADPWTDLCMSTPPAPRSHSCFPSSTTQWSATLPASSAVAFYGSVPCRLSGISAVFADRPLSSRHVAQPHHKTTQVAPTWLHIAPISLRSMRDHQCHTSLSCISSYCKNSWAAPDHTEIHTLSFHAGSVSSQPLTLVAEVCNACCLFPRVGLSSCQAVLSYNPRLLQTSLCCVCLREYPAQTYISGRVPTPQTHRSVCQKLNQQKLLAQRSSHRQVLRILLVMLVRHLL